MESLNARELRIGNLIYQRGKYNKAERVKVDINILKDIIENNQNYLPIELTKYELTHNGINKSKDVLYKHPIEQDLYLIDRKYGLTGYFINNGFIFNIWDEIYAVKFIHQFQNFYFALTGKEKEFK